VQNVGGQIFSIFLVGPLGGPLSGPQSGPGSGTRSGGSYFSMQGRQGVVPTGESSILRVEKNKPQGRESDLSRSSFDP